MYGYQKKSMAGLREDNSGIQNLDYIDVLNNDLQDENVTKYEFSVKIFTSMYYMIFHLWANNFVACNICWMVRAWRYKFINDQF